MRTELFQHFNEYDFAVPVMLDCSLIFVDERDLIYTYIIDKQISCKMNCFKYSNVSFFGRGRIRKYAANVFALHIF